MCFEHMKIKCLHVFTLNEFSSHLHYTSALERCPSDDSDQLPWPSHVLAQIDFKLGLLAPNLISLTRLHCNCTHTSQFYTPNNGGALLLSPDHGTDLHYQQSDPIMLLSGPPSSGKTSLLFQFAFNAAASAEDRSSGNHHVVFICNRGRLESKPPYLSQGVDPSCDTFQHIQMKYVDDDEGIKKYFAAFHLYDKFPAAVVIDDFGDFFDDRTCQERYGNPRGRDLAMVRILALCHNAVIHANEKRQCKILLSDTHHGDSPRLLFIYKRWVRSIFTIKGDDGRGSFLLTSNRNEGSENCKRLRTAKYSIALQYLILEGRKKPINSNMQ